MFSDPKDLLFASGCAWHGVTIGWSLEVDKYVTKLPTISDRFCGISFRNGHTNALFYSLYLPTSGKDEEFLEVLTKLSSDITKHRTAHESINIGADTNQSIKSSHRRTDAMKDFQNEIDLHSISKSDEATFHHNNQTSSSQIDHILCHISEISKITIHFLKHICTLKDSDNLSSHDVIIGMMNIPVITEDAVVNDYSETYENFSVKKPKWNLTNLQDYQNQTFSVLHEIVENYDEPEFIPALCEMISKTFVLSAELNFDTTNPNHNKKKVDVPKFTKEQIEAYEAHRRACISWREAGRTKEATHPAKALKLSSQKNLQNVNRKKSSEKAIKLNELKLNECISHACDIILNMRP